MPVTPAPPANRRDAAASAGLLAALAVSQVGFLGYYDLGGFHSFAPVLVLAVLMVALLVAAGAAAPRLIAGVGRLWPLFALAAWAGTTALWSDDPVLVLRRAGLVFVPGVLVALLAVTDPAPARTFARVTWLLVAIALASTVFAVVSLTIGERIDIDKGALSVRLLDIGESGLGVAVAARGIFFEYSQNFRPSGLSSNANGAGIMAAVALVCMIVRDGGAIVREAARAATAAVLVTAVALTFSRGAFLFVLVCTGLFAARRVGRGGAALGAFVLVAILPLVVAGLVESDMRGSIAGDPASVSEFYQLGARWEVMIIVHDAIATVWPLGVGFGTVEEVVFAPLGRTTGAHSAQLSILAETGIVGLVLLVIAWLGHGALRLNSGRGTLASGLAIVVVGLYAHQVFDSAAFRFHPLHFLLVYFIGVLANPKLVPRGGVAADGG